MFDLIDGIHNGGYGSKILKDCILPGTIENFELAGWPLSGWYRDYAFGDVSPLELFDMSVLWAKEAKESSLLVEQTGKVIK